jgi:1-deoxy-D-xylulose-5-phosphate synthase
MGLLESIDGPAQVRALDEARLPALAEELRRFILDSVSRTGGHLGTNLGVVELTVALLHVFDPPRTRSSGTRRTRPTPTRS